MATTSAATLSISGRDDSVMPAVGVDSSLSESFAVKSLTTSVCEAGPTVEKSVLPDSSVG